MSGTTRHIAQRGEEGDGPEVAQVIRDGVLYVTINRPQKRNALNRATLGALREVFENAATDMSLHAAVLTGAGDKSFAAGGDLHEFDLLRSEADAIALFDHAAATLDAIRLLPVPVVAALNGTALGGGAELAMACDNRVAAAHVKFGFVQATLAITTGFGGGADLFARFGSAAAMNLLARAELMSAADATAAGLIDSLTGPQESLDAAVDAFIQPFRSRAPHLMRAIKQIALAEHGPRRDRYRQAERRSFVTTWTDAAHWQAAAHVLARTGQGDSR